MNNPDEVKYCACCGQPLTRIDYTLRTVIHQVDCRNDKSCPAYFKTTIAEEYTGMIDRFGLVAVYDVRTGQPLAVCSG